MNVSVCLSVGLCVLLMCLQCARYKDDALDGAQLSGCWWRHIHEQTMTGEILVAYQEDASDCRINIEDDVLDEYILAGDSTLAFRWRYSLEDSRLYRWNGFLVARTDEVSLFGDTLVFERDSARLTFRRCAGSLLPFSWPPQVLLDSVRWEELPKYAF